MGKYTKDQAAGRIVKLEVENARLPGPTSGAYACYLTSFPCLKYLYSHLVCSRIVNACLVDEALL